MGNDSDISFFLMLRIKWRTKFQINCHCVQKQYFLAKLINETKI